MINKLKTMRTNKDNIGQQRTVLDMLHCCSGTCCIASHQPIQCSHNMLFAYNYSEDYACRCQKYLPQRPILSQSRQSGNLYLSIYYRHYWLFTDYHDSSPHQWCSWACNVENKQHNNIHSCVSFLGSWFKIWKLLHVDLYFQRHFQEYNMAVVNCLAMFLVWLSLKRGTSLNLDLEGRYLTSLSIDDAYRLGMRNVMCQITLPWWFAWPIISGWSSDCIICNCLMVHHMYSHCIPSWWQCWPMEQALNLFGNSPWCSAT